MIPALMVVLICLNPGAASTGDLSSCEVVQVQPVMVPAPESESESEPTPPAPDCEKEDCS